jgi:tripartite-type tricarboxylate transporter receptor subunit TctC
VLGFGSEKRIAQYPDVPTIAETLPGYEAASWYGLVAPAGTPREIVAKLSAATQKIFAEPGFREKFLAPSMIFSIAGTPEDFAQRIKADYAKWGKVLKDAGVKVE